MKLILKEKKQETPDVTTFIFEPSEKLEWKAGQFLHYVLHHDKTDDRGSDRWFTISSAPFEGHVNITTRFNNQRSSTFKETLKNLKEGGEIEASEVDGDFIVDDPQKEMVFIAGGIGVTPFRSILLQLDHEGKNLNIHLLYANRSEDNIPFKEEFESLAKKHPEFKITYIIDPEKLNEETLKKYLPDLAIPIFYVSGPEPMVDSLGETLKSLGVAEDRLKQDWFPGYPAE